MMVEVSVEVICCVIFVFGGGDVLMCYLLGEKYLGVF